MEIALAKRKSGDRARPRRARPRNPRRDTIHDNGSEYTAEEIELLRAVDRYRREAGKKFVRIVEVLRILKELGWVRPER